MVSSCSQNNVLSSDMHSHNHLSTPNRLGCRDLAQTVAPGTPQMIKTPVPRMRSTARSLHVLTPQTAPCDDQDRFIPSRRRMNMDLCRRKLNSASKSCESSNVACVGPPSAARLMKLPYKKQLLSTLCNVSTSDLDDELQLKSLMKYGSVSPSMTSNRRPIVAADPFAMDSLRSSSCGFNALSQKLNVAVTKRTISPHPAKSLNARGIVDDYYTNPISWSKDNVLAVALGISVYLMNESTGAVQEIAGAGKTPVDQRGLSNHVRSVKWCTMEGSTHHLAVATSVGFVRIFDTTCGKEIMRTNMGCRNSTMRAVCWNDSRQYLTAGYTNGKIGNHDLRSGVETTMTMAPSVGGSSSVCNLAWNSEGSCLASGRNDNMVHLWDASMTRSAESGRGQSPRHILQSHTGAVKGLAWCPYRRDVLASGGGTADGCIKLWNACSGSLLKSVATGSQVCSLIWGQHHQELYSGHGYGDEMSSSANAVVAWSYPKMEQIQIMRGHEGRILSMGMSPDGTKLASMGADNSLCIWKVDAVPASSRSGSAGAANCLASPSFGSRFAIR